MEEISGERQLLKESWIGPWNVLNPSEGPVSALCAGGTGWALPESYKMTSTRSLVWSVSDQKILKQSLWWGWPEGPTSLVGPVLTAWHHGARLELPLCSQNWQVYPWRSCAFHKWEQVHPWAHVTDVKGSGEAVENISSLNIIVSVTGLWWWVSDGLGGIFHGGIAQTSTV